MQNSSSKFFLLHCCETMITREDSFKSLLLASYTNIKERADDGECLFASSMDKLSEYAEVPS